MSPLTEVTLGICLSKELDVDFSGARESGSLCSRSLNFVHFNVFKLRPFGCFFHSFLMQVP